MTQRENTTDFANKTLEELRNDVKNAIMELTVDQQIELWIELVTLGIIKGGRN